MAECQAERYTNQGGQERVVLYKSMAMQRCWPAVMLANKRLICRLPYNSYMYSRYS